MGAAPFYRRLAAKPSIGVTMNAYPISVLGFGDNVVDKYEHIGTMYPGGNAVNFAVFAKKLGVDRSAYMGIFGSDAEAEHVISSLGEEGVELVDIKKDKDLINVAVRGYRSNISHVKLPRLLLEAEHIINLPILKAHASMVFSGALKNIKGVVQDQVHVQMHQHNLTMAMMDVWWACRADINIMDVMHAASGYSPHTPVPIEVDCIMGSYDPVALDRIACELVGIDTDGVDYFRVAQEAGLGTTNRDDIEVVGDKVADCYKKMWVPYLEDIRNRWPEYEVHCEGACSSCQALLTLNMETLKAIGVYDDNTDMVVVAGGRNTLSPDTPDEKILLHGNCARKHLKEHPNAFFLQGCPPGEGSLYMSVLRKEAMTGKPEQMHWIRERMEIDAPAWRSYVEKEAEKFYGSDDK